MKLTLSAFVNVLRCLIWETFRQALASRIVWVIFVVTAVCILFCASVGVTGKAIEREPGQKTELLPAKDPDVDPDKLTKSGVQTVHGEMSLAFGAVRVPHARDSVDSVRGLQLVLANGVAGTLGLLLTLVWTAGFLPTFLEPQAASVLLTKPVPRWLLVLGKFVGTTLFVGLQATLFVFGTWAALGLATGVWEQGYLLTIPLVILQFVFFYSFSAFLAVATRSTAICMIGTALFWLLCGAVNVSRIETQAGLIELPTVARWATETAYWALPKPIDLSKLMSDALGSGRYFAEWDALKNYRPAEASLLSSLAFSVGMLVMSAVDLRRIDY